MGCFEIALVMGKEARRAIGSALTEIFSIGNQGSKPLEIHGIVLSCPPSEGGNNWRTAKFER